MAAATSPLLLLAVCTLPNPAEMKYTNCTYHNKMDFDGKESVIIKINSSLYLSKHSDLIFIGTIALSAPMRKINKIELGEKHEFPVFTLAPNTSYREMMGKVTIDVVPYNPNNEERKVSTLHEHEIMDHLNSILEGKPVGTKQWFLFKMNDENFLCQISCRFICSYSSKSVTFEVNSKFPQLTIISGKLLKRDLFSDGFSFDKIGIGGLDTQLKTMFRDALSSRAISSELVQKLGLRHVKGMVLHGPSGTGKTLFARKIGGLISNIPPTIINGPELMSKWVGQGPQNLRDLFANAQADFEKNGDKADLHVFIFDEMDAMFTVRGGDSAGAGANTQMVNQFLTIIDGVKPLNNIFVIGMTNRLDLIDPALLRAGRLGIHLEISLPDKKGRESIFEIHTKAMHTNHMVDEKLNLKFLADITENYSGSEIEAVCNCATARAVHRIISKPNASAGASEDAIRITMDDMLYGVSQTAPLFGKMSKHVDTILPLEYKMRPHLEDARIVTTMNTILENKERLNVVLLTGSVRSGKTTLMAHVMKENECKYGRFIRAIDVLGMPDLNKSKYLTNHIIDGHKSDKSLIIIDDLENILNFANVGGIVYSNHIYQSLITCLKTPPSNITHSLTIVLIAFHNVMYDMFSDYATQHLDMFKEPTVPLTSLVETL